MLGPFSEQIYLPLQLANQVEEHVGCEGGLGASNRGCAKRGVTYIWRGDDLTRRRQRGRRWARESAYYRFHLVDACSHVAISCLRALPNEGEHLEDRFTRYPRLGRELLEVDCKLIHLFP